MKRIALTFAALGILSVFNAPANASDLSVLLRKLIHGQHHYAAQKNHARHHAALEHRAYHRELDHRTAHRYPMTHRQHDALHYRLDYEAHRDRLEHRSAHRTRAYSPYGSLRYDPRPSPRYHGYGYAVPRPYCR